MRTRLTWGLSHFVRAIAHYISRGEILPALEEADMDATTRTETTGDASLPTHLLLTAEQASASLAICRTKVYELLRNGQLESIRIGASRRIPAAALAENVERIRDEQRRESGISCTSDTSWRAFSKMDTTPHTTGGVRQQ